MATWLRKSVFLLLCTLPAYGMAAELAPSEKRRAESEAIEVLKRIVSLWKDGKFEEVYEQGYRANQTSISKESFVRRMRQKPWKLSLSWETLQDIQAEVISRKSVYVKARIGFKKKTNGETKFSTQTFRLKLEGGTWRVDLSQLLASPKERG